MLPGCDLRHHAAKPVVEVSLTREGVSNDPATVFDDSDSALITRRFDPQDAQEADYSLCG